jgi:hypothetical protein
MKKITLLSFAVLFSTMMFAKTYPENSFPASKVSVKKGNENTFSLMYKPEKSTNVNISIVDATGAVIFTETLKNTEGFMRPYNFSGLKEGIYTLEVADAFGEHTELVDYRSDRVEKSISLKKIGSEGKYLLTASGQGEEAITVTIYDALDNLIHRETSITEGNFGQVYNLGKMTDGVTFEIASADGTVKTVKF